MSRSLRVLSLQPYFGGSHKQFHNGWVANSAHQWTTLTLPARHWKWRMRHASVYFSSQLQNLIEKGNTWDVIVCTDMLNVAEFNGLVGPKIAALPLVLYFHENQFAYPNRVGFKRDQHFPFTNFTSALAADRLWFNSRFNFDSMIIGLEQQSERWPDFEPREEIASLESKMEVQPPGIDSPPIDVAEFLQRRIARAEHKQPIHIVWAARWEHDKNAKDLLVALKQLAAEKVPFRISVMGQSFRFEPETFVEIKATFSDQIVRWGFQKTREAYWEALAEADVFVSTANHEFFGLAAAESIAVGLHPLFPNRLAYPELLCRATGSTENQRYLYESTATDLTDSLIEFHRQRINGDYKFDLEVAHRLLEQVSWDRRGLQLDEALNAVVDH